MKEVGDIYNWRGNSHRRKVQKLGTDWPPSGLVVLEDYVTEINSPMGQHTFPPGYILRLSP